MAEVHAAASANTMGVAQDERDNNHYYTSHMKNTANYYSSTSHWSVKDEIKFIKRLSPTKLLQYISTLPLRQNWGKIDEDKIKQFLWDKKKIDLG